MNDKVKGKKNIEQDEGIVKDTMVSRVFASVLDKMQFSQTRQLPPDDVLVGAKKKKKRIFLVLVAVSIFYLVETSGNIFINHVLSWTYFNSTLKNSSNILQNLSRNGMLRKLLR